jgi:HSP20 family molecular chaperone IbpA
MTSFFDKLTLKMNGGKAKAPATARSLDPVAKFASSHGKPNVAQPALEEELLNSQRLDVDVYQDPVKIVVYALAPGVDPDAFDVILDEENDLLSIRGVRKRPEAAPPGGDHKDEGKFVQQECSWEPFFRKIVLPLEVDPVKAEAVFKKGVLIITLPILNVTEGRKLAVQEVLTRQP